MVVPEFVGQLVDDLYLAGPPASGVVHHGVESAVLIHRYGDRGLDVTG